MNGKQKTQILIAVCMSVKTLQNTVVTADSYLASTLGGPNFKSFLTSSR